MRVAASPGGAAAPRSPILYRNGLFVLAKALPNFWPQPTLRASLQASAAKFSDNPQTYPQILVDIAKTTTLGGSGAIAA
jgi:hypothetical protein